LRRRHKPPHNEEREMHKGQVEATRRWRDNQNKRGNRAVTVQCPVERIEELKALARAWREEAKRPHLPNTQ
jgi:hypothetical protein